jgi:uncharacterized protein
MGQSSSNTRLVWRKRILRALRICFALYLLVCAGCAGFQRKMIYFPPVLDSAKVDRLGTSAKLERWNDSSGRPIGWKRLSPANNAQGQVLILHGNGNGAFQCGHYVDVLQQVAPLDVFIVEYPGYSDRSGAPNERSLDTSADEEFLSLSTNSPVYLVGESLGTGVATWLAGAHPDRVAGIVLLAPFNSLTDVAQYHAPILPVHLMLVDRFPAEKYLRTYHGPIAVLVGGEDQVVPEKFGHRLYDRYDGPKRLWEFPGGNHGTVMIQPPEVWEQIIDFLQVNRLAPK